MGTILREIKQSKPFTHPQEEAFIVLLRTSDVLRGAIDRLFASWGISTEQYNVLRILAGAPDGHPTLEVASRMVSRAPNITRLIDKLVEKKLVRRENRKGDRRVVVIRITPMGQKLLNESNPIVKKTTLQLMSGLSEAQIQSLILALDALRANISEGNHA